MELTFCSHVMVTSVVLLRAADRVCSVTIYLLFSFLLSAGFGSLPAFVLHEPVTEFLTEFLSCSCRLCVWWRSAVSPLSSYLVSAGLILSRSLCFTGLSPSSLSSSSPIPVDREPGGDGEGRDGRRGEARWVQEDSHL